MYNFLDKTRWKSIYKNDYLYKIEELEKALKKDDIEQTEVCYVLLASSAFYLLRHYFAYKDISLFKRKDLLETAIAMKIITDKEAWLKITKLVDRIGRAVRPKEENIPVIAGFVKYFHDFADNFEVIFEKETEKEE